MRTFLTCIMAFVCAFTFAQKKPNINKAKSALDKGELAEAKTMIEQAITYEKTKDNAKTWYYRGMIYATLDTAANEADALETAVMSFNKALELDPEQKSVSSFTATGIENVDSNLQGYYGFYYNKAVIDYQSENYESAADNFEKSNYIMPSDSNSAVNAAYASVAYGDSDRAQKNFERALEAGMKDISIHLSLYNYAAVKEDYEGALAILENAAETYPDNSEIQKFKINILIKLDRIDEAKDGIVEAIAAEPDNADLHFSLGVIQEEEGKLEEAVVSYRNGIEADPSHYNSNFNLGVMIFNRSNELIKERNALGYKETKKYDELTVKINEQLKTALPLWEKLYSIQSDDRVVLETLGYIYSNLNMKAENEKVSKELDALN